MSTVFVNDIEVEVGPKDNLIQAARAAGVEIPHYCWHEALSVVASCRMCLVEVGEKKPDGTIAMGPKLVPACQTPAKPGTVVKTETAKVKTAQQMTLEFLLLNHPLDCSICDQAGECYLQDYTFKFGKAQSRLNEPKVQRLDKYHIGEQIALFTDRCVMCTRCVRFTREISGTAELQVVARGSVEEIDVFPNKPCNNKLAGNVVDLCPVGALCSKDFMYKKRVWWLKSQKSVCAGCSTGCSIEVDQNEDHVYRLRPRANPLAQGHFMCDEGRFGFKYVQSPNRLSGPTSKAINTLGAAPSAIQNGNGSIAGKLFQPADLAIVDHWPAAIQEAREKIKLAIDSNASGFAAVFSPMMSVEEAYLLASYLKGLNRNVKLLMGPVPVVGQDDCYPKNVDGSGPIAEETKFTIRAEKCPNRLGVEKVLKHFQGAVVAIDEAIRGAHGIQSWYFVGGYATPDDSSSWVTAAIAKATESAKLLIVQDIFPSILSKKADIVLAGAAFTERDGTFINHSGLAQSFRAATRPPKASRTDGRILNELCQRQGLFNVEVLRKEIASKVPSLESLSVGDLGVHGVELQQLVGAYS